MENRPKISKWLYSWIPCVQKKLLIRNIILLWTNFLTNQFTVNMVIFAWGKFRENIGKTFSRGGNFHSYFLHKGIWVLFLHGGNFCADNKSAKITPVQKFPRFTASGSTYLLTTACMNSSKKSSYSFSSDSVLPQSYVQGIIQECL